MSHPAYGRGVEDFSNIVQIMAEGILISTYYNR